MEDRRWAGLARLAAAVTSNKSPGALRLIQGLTLFGFAFGYIEAAVVVYLRTLGSPVRAAAGLSTQELFPLLRLNQLPPAMLALLRIELSREAATLILLAAAAWLVSRRAASQLGAFVLAFGVWDLAFYLWLRVLIGWPPSVMTWDLLFLIPVPWTAPVLAPVIVAATMSAFGAIILKREPPQLALRAGFLLSAGFGVIFASFIWDWNRLMNGGMPGDFPWIVFALGEAVLIAGFLGLASARPARATA